MRYPGSRFVSVFLCSWQCLASLLFADELDDRLKGFRDAASTHLKEWRERLAAEGEERRENRPREVALAYVTRLVERLNTEANVAWLHSPRASEEIDAIARNGELPAALRTLISELVRDLPLLLEKRAESQLAEANRLIKEAAKACLDAKSEADLDPMLRELGRFATQMRFATLAPERNERAVGRVQAAIQAVSTWQDYLAHLALGNVTGAQTTLQRLRDDQQFPIIAQDEIQKRLPKKSPNELRDALAKIAEVRRIDDLHPTLEQIRNRLATAADVSWKPIIKPFERLAAAAASMRAGFYTEAFRIATGTMYGEVSAPTPDWEPDFSRLRGDLLVAVLPKYLEIPELLPPNQGENAAEYLLRSVEELIKNARFAECVRVLEVYRTVSFDGSAPAPAWIEADITGLRSYAAGTRLADAGSWAEGINHFRKAAETAGRFTPVKEAASRLAELITAHPEEAKVAARLLETEALYQRISREISSDAAKALESRLPPEIRQRLRPTP